MQLVAPTIAAAESVEKLDQETTTLTKQSEQINGDIQLALNAANQQYQSVATIKEKIVDNQSTLKATKTEIKQTKETIEKRKKIVAKRLKEVQVNRFHEKSIIALLDSKSINQFVNRAFALSTIQRAEQNKVTDLTNAQEKLVDLKATQEKTQADLVEQESNLTTEAGQLDTKLTDLKTELANNQSSLQQISQAKEVEAARVAAEAAQTEEKAAEAEKNSATVTSSQTTESTTTTESTKATEDTTTVESTTSSSSTETSESQPAPTNNTPTPAPVETPITNTGGKTITMQSTAYSFAESANTFWTATGIDLRQNPQVVAVDPSVIPLGSMVEVSGYGIAIAGDTGGAIKGNIIDCHFATVGECIQWGRRSVTVTILS
ncbi:peptidase M23 [Enterococcus sp. ALS3]|uniref:Peptidase M23 n=2 Tax=Enterococcus alishanensis TaxID=1303817 RepID=A0ABS6TFK8_9ENTE|nr:peptidase M23 [Enterococcus alishanensis]